MDGRFGQPAAAGTRRGGRAGFVSARTGHRGASSDGPPAGSKNEREWPAERSKKWTPKSPARPPLMPPPAAGGFAGVLESAPGTRPSLRTRPSDHRLAFWSPASRVSRRPPPRYKPGIKKNLFCLSGPKKEEPAGGKKSRKHGQQRGSESKTSRKMTEGEDPKMRSLIEIE